MGFVLDHLFICTTVGAREADHLVALGLTEAGGNVHNGQGTSNRRFFWRNAGLECLWVHDKLEVQNAQVHPTRLWERWRYQTTGASPFGIALRPDVSPAPLAPFDSWSYKPPYLPDSLSIAIGTNASVIEEPLCFYLPFGRRPDAMAAVRRPPLNHALECQEVTGLQITLSHNTPSSSVLQRIEQLGVAAFSRGRENLAEVVLDHGLQGKQADLRPSLPVRIRY